MASSSPVVSVRRQKPILVRPGEPTPHEFKALSDIDDQEGLRFHIPVILFYNASGTTSTNNPATVIRVALEKALVYYYPLAGRLREGPGRKLIVECTGEGVLFVEAEADVRLEQFGDALQPPFPGLRELLCNDEGSFGILGCPLIHVQVTTLKCGGFIFALQLNHTMSDAPGLVQFISAVAELACGNVVPTIQPAWSRHLLTARMPPRQTHLHREYDNPSAAKTVLTFSANGELVQRSFFFGPAELSAISKRMLPSSHRNWTSFEILTAFLWRSRTIAIQPHRDEETRVLCIVNARCKSDSLLPAGYYGNAFSFTAAVTTANELCNNTLANALELVKKAKDEVNWEYIQSVADLMVLRGRPDLAAHGRCAWLASDVRFAGLDKVDFGWGLPIFGGPAEGGVGTNPGASSFFIRSKNAKGEEGVLVPFCLPAPEMERLAMEIERSVYNKPFEKEHGSALVKSSL